MSYREHEKHSLEVAELVLLHDGIESRRVALEAVNRGTARGAKLQEQNSVIAVVEITDSPAVEPLPGVLLVDEQRLVEVAGAEDVGVDEAVEEVGGVVVAAGDDADYDDAVGARRRRSGRVVGGGGWRWRRRRRRRAGEDSNRRGRGVSFSCVHQRREVSVLGSSRFGASAMLLHLHPLFCYFLIYYYYF